MQFFLSGGRRILNQLQAGDAAAKQAASKAAQDDNWQDDQNNRVQVSFRPYHQSKGRLFGIANDNIFTGLLAAGREISPLNDSVEKLKPA